MSDEYHPNSVDATLSRIETKLDATLRTQDQHAAAIRKLWAALGRLDVRVAVITCVVSGILAIAKLLFFHQ